jgi:hypothetical protein
MVKSSWWRSSEFGAKANRLPDFIFDTLLFGTAFFFLRFQTIAIEKGLLLSFLVGIGLAFVAGLARYLLKPSVDKWKLALKKRRDGKSRGLNNLS